MSTRKSCAAAAAALKPDHATSTAENSHGLTTTTSAVVPTSKELEKPDEMGANTSASSLNGEKSDSEKETAQKLPESKRVTRNSPMLCTSPTVKKEPGNIDAEMSNSNANSEGEESGHAKKSSVTIRARKSIKEAKEAIKETEIEEAVKETGEDAGDREKTKETKDTKDPTTKQTEDHSREKLSRDSTKEPKEEPKEKPKGTAVTSSSTGAAASSNSSHSTSPPSTTNRLTRKALADEMASKTRMTRNRQASAGSTTRPETPPTNISNRVRNRQAAGAARKANEAVSQKRKRSVEEAVDPAVATKFIKLEPKDEEDSDTTMATSQDMVKVKQEVLDSDDSNTTDVTQASATSAPQASRGRNSRWSTRRPNKTMSPSTRATRQTKVASPAPAATASEPKRRRTAGSAKGSSSKLANNTAGGLVDEDSKDSLASSSVDESASLLLAEIKTEKLTPDILDDATDSEIPEKPDNSTAKDPTESPSEAPNEKAAEDEAKDCDLALKADKIREPLTVCTETEARDDELTPATDSVDPPITPEAEASTTTLIASNDSDKDEMVSEGVSEISVTQFYKKPKFLENNLGIEEDPKLGEIVQKATTEIDTNVPNPSKGHDEEPERGEDASKTADTVGPRTESSEEELAQAPLTKEPADELLDTKLDEILGDESNDSRKAKDELSSLNTSCLSPLVMEEDTDADEQTENASVVPADVPKTHASSEVAENGEVGELVEASSEKSKADLDDDDDATVEESETVSMDNNPSVPDDLAAEEDDDEDGHGDGDEGAGANEGKDGDDAKPSVHGNTEDSKLHDILLNGTESLPTDGKENLENLEETFCNETEDKAAEDVEQAEVIEVADNQRQDPNAVEAENGEKPIEKADEKPLKCLAAEEVASTEVLKEESTKDEAKLVIKISTALQESEEEAKENFEEKANQNSALKCELSQEKVESESQPEAEPGPEPQTTDGVKELQALEESKVQPMEVDEVNAAEGKEEKKEEMEDRKEAKVEEQQDFMDQSADMVESEKPLQTLASSCAADVPLGSNEECAAVGNKDENKVAKEQLLQNLGLLTLKAAEKQRQENIKNSVAAYEASRTQQQQQAPYTHSQAQTQPQQQSKRHSKASVASSATSHEYTGTLKTVIKLNRSGSTTASSSASSASNFTASVAASAASSRKSSQNQSNCSGPTTNANAKDGGVRRQSLKITFQKGRAQGRSDRNGGNNNDAHDHLEEAYYTIQNENEGLPELPFNTSSSNSSNNNSNNSNKSANNTEYHSNYNNSIASSSTHGIRKSYYNRSNTNSANSNITNSASNVESSHSEDTNSHHGVTSHKKDEKEKILIPEKASSFKFHPGRLCEDQCYYCSGKFGLYDTPCHVGQIKSVERQQKILQNEEKLTVDNCLCDACFRHVDRRANVPSYKKRLSASGHLESTEAGEDGNANEEAESSAARKCIIPDCESPASHSLRRKCIRKTVKKLLLNFDMPAGSTYIWLCQTHYNTVIQCSGCVLCKRRLGKNHMYHITSDTERLEKALTELGIPVQLGMGTAVCKLCRYFANLLMKPLDSSKSQKAEFVQNYRKRLLKFHNINDGSNEASEADEEDSNSGMSADPRKVAKADKDSPSPAASTTSSVVCVNEEGSDKALRQVVDAEARDENTDFEMSSAGAQHSGADSSNASSKSSTPPAPSVKHISKLKAILQGGKSQGSSNNAADISSVLRSNPNISMRELFPGEEDLGLSFKADFGGSGSHRTPEGWTRVQTFLQYDEPTRRLWEELQKPYGNQSSFLRHLILLEKYYRNGDLMLAPHASSNANVYTQTVRQRLVSYDDGQCPAFLQSPAAVGAAAKHVAAAHEVVPAVNEGKAKRSNARDSTENMEIPTVEIPEDDDDDEVMRNNNGDDSNDSVQAVPLTDNGKAISDGTAKNEKRSNSCSVDKLTKQLNTNAVTIIAKPKDSSLAANSSNQPKQRSLLKEKDGAAISAGKASTSIMGSMSGNASLMGNVNSTLLASSAASGASAANSNSSANANNSRSVLKSNLLGNINKSVDILPISSVNNSARVQDQHSRLGLAGAMGSSAMLFPSSGIASAGSNGKQSKILEVANKLQAAAASTNKQSRSSLPAQTQAQSQSQSPLQSQAQGQPQTSSFLDLVNMQRRSLPSASSHGSNGGSSAPNTSTTTSAMNSKKGLSMHKNRNSHLFILPDTLTPQERAESKTWRPTLLPINEHQHQQNKDGPIYQTADGRRLPSLVQVQSGGKPFLISIFDYNRMCILRREKLLRDQMLKSSKSRGSDNKAPQQQQQQQPQHSKAAGSNMPAQASSSSSKSSSQVAKQQQAAAQLMQLQMQMQKQQQQAMKSGGGGGGMNVNSNLLSNPNSRFAPKTTAAMTATSTAGSSSMLNPLALAHNSNSGGAMPGSNRLTTANPFSMPLLANAITAAAAASNPSALAAFSNNPWLWNHFPEASELLRNGAPPATKMPPLMPIPPVTTSGGMGTSSSASSSSSSAGGSSASPATLLEKQLQQQYFLPKIPKSLTVIPQHKLMGVNASANANSNNNGNNKKE